MSQMVESSESTLRSMYMYYVLSDICDIIYLWCNQEWWHWPIYHYKCHLEIILYHKNYLYQIICKHIIASTCCLFPDEIQNFYKKLISIKYF